MGEEGGAAAGTRRRLLEKQRRQALLPADGDGESSSAPSAGAGAGASASPPPSPSWTATGARAALLLQQQQRRHLHQEEREVDAVACTRAAANPSSALQQGMDHQQGRQAALSLQDEQAHDIHQAHPESLPSSPTAGSSQHPPPPHPPTDPNQPGTEPKLALSNRSVLNLNLNRSFRAGDNLRTIYFTVKDSDDFLANLTEDEVRLFLQKATQPNRLCSFPESTLAYFLDAITQTHGKIIIGYASEVILLLIRTMTVCPSSASVCFKVLDALLTHSFNELRTEDEKRQTLSCMYLPLQDALMRSNAGVSGSAALLLASITKSSIWQLASPELVKDLCWKSSLTLEERNNRTAHQMKLLVCLSEENISTLVLYRRSLIKSADSILEGCSKVRCLQLTILCIQMVQAIMDVTDLNMPEDDLRVILDTMSLYADDNDNIISCAAFVAAETARVISKQRDKMPSDSEQDVIYKYHDDLAPSNENLRKKMQDVLYEYHELFVCAYDKSEWSSLKTYSKRNHDDLTQRTETPGNYLKYPYIQIKTSDVLKFIFKRSYHQLKNLHRSGLSFGGLFSSDNIMIDGYWNIKFGGIKRISKYTEENGDEDLHRFVNMVNKEVFLSSKRPTDIQIWLDLVDDCNEYYEELCIYHISLMDDRAAASAFFSLVDALDELQKLAPTLYEKVIKNLAATESYSSWQLNVNRRQGNMYLRRTMKYRYDKGYDDYKDDIEGLLLMLRNSRQHSGKWIEEHFVSVMCQHFPKLLADLQKAMFEIGYLPNLYLKHSMGFLKEKGASPQNRSD